MSKFRLDEVDHQILDMLIDNTRVPFTDIAKKITYICRNCTCQSKENGRCWHHHGIFISSFMIS
jgi:hypothetical protein